MSKTLLAVAFSATLAATLSAAAPAPAKTFKLGGQSPVASISLPDGWTGDAADGGLEALSPARDIYLSAEVVATEDLKSTGRELARTLKEQKIVLKQESRTVAPITLAGMPGAAVAWEASDSEGATQVHMIVVKAKPDREVVLLRWGDEAAEKAHAGEIDGIVRSLAPEK